MKGNKLNRAWLVTGLLGATIPAHAGGFERSSQDFDILFEQGNVVEGSATLVMPQRKLKNISGSRVGEATQGINPIPGTNYGQSYDTTIEEGKTYWAPKISARFQLTDDLACAAQFREPWGIHSDVGTNTVRMFSAIEQTISSRDYGLNCSYRFMTTEKGYLRLLGGISYQELKGYQTWMVPPGSPFGGSFRVATLDVEDESFGWCLGAAYEIPEIALRGSVVYQSKVKYTLSGDITNLALFQGLGGTPIEIASDVATPQSVEIKVQTGIAHNWLAFGSIKWVDWKSLQQVDFSATDSKVTSAGQKITSLNLYYRDGWTVSGGVGHKFNDQWSSVATVTWDRGTTTGLSSQTNSWLIGLGTSFKPHPSIDIRLAGALGLLTAGEMDDRIVNGIPTVTGSRGDFGTDLITALSVSAKVKF